MAERKMNKLTMLHISDTHFKCSDDLTDTKFTAFFQYLSGLAENELKNEHSVPAAVIFSGDLAFGGKENEFAVAEKFFDRVLEAFKVEDKKRLFIIPGNHDVNWDLITPQHADQMMDIRAKDCYGKDYDRLLKSEDLLRPFMVKFRGYQGFSTAYLKRPFDEKNHYYADLVQIGNLLIGIASFNSAWLVTKHEGEGPGRLLQLIGLEPLKRTLPTLEKAHLRIVLLHHPPYWLLESTARDIGLYLQQNADLILCGHEVGENFQQTSLAGEEKRCFYVQGGPLHNVEGPPSRFNLIRFGTIGIEKKLTVIPYCFSPSSGGSFWREDKELEERDKNYNKSITLGKIRLSPETTYPELQALIDQLKFCELLRAKRFSSPAGKNKILDFYCGSPLRWEIIAANGDIRRSLEKSILDEAMRSSNDFRIICIVAEPGAGKSTLAWRVAYELFQQENIVVQADNSDEKLWQKLPQLARFIGRHFYVLVDDIFQKREFVRDLERLSRDPLPVTILATARQNEFNTGGIDRRLINRIDLRLDEQEKNSLLDRLGKSYNALNEEMQQAFRTADLFLVLGMVLTKGQSFERIIRSMIESLAEEDKKHSDSSFTFSTAFKFVCFSFSYGLSIPEELLSNLHADRRFDGILDKEPVEGILYEDPRVGTKTRFVRVGHQVIAEEAVRIFTTGRFGTFNPRVLYTDLLEATDENDQVQRYYIASLTNSISVRSEEATKILGEINVRNSKVLRLLVHATISELGLWRMIFNRLKQLEGVKKCSDEILLRSPLTPSDCQILVSEHQNRKDGKAVPTMELWLKNNPDDGAILARYVHQIRESGDEKQVKCAIAKAEEWTPKHPEDTAVRQAYIALVKKKGSREQADKLIEEIASWLEEHPYANQVYQTFIELVGDRCEQEDTIKKTIRDANSWLKDHEENTNVRTVYIQLIGKKGFIGTEDIVRALADTENWMRKYGPNPIFKDYLAHLVKKVTKGSIGIIINPNVVKELGNKSISSCDWKDDSEFVDGFARWLSYEGFFEESENIYRKLISQDLWWERKADMLFGYGMLFMSKTMNQKHDTQASLENLERAERLFEEALAVNRDHIAALAFLAISLKEQGFFAESAEAFKDAEWLSRNPSRRVKWTSGKLFSEIGKFYLEFGRYVEAKEWFSKALSEAQIFPHWWGLARANLGIATDLKRRGRIREAKSLFAEALLELENALKDRPAPFQLPASRDIPNQIQTCKSEIVACDALLRD
jgi:tetratricopeptide (TPR) repeat protein